jgi:hypothetical protein
MRLTQVVILLFVSSVCRGAEDETQASGRLHGKQVRFPAAGLAQGVKATLGLLESCHNESLYSSAELTKALQGDHVQLVFAKPITVVVMGEMVKASELVISLPLNTGVFWLRSGDKVRRYAKFEYQKEKAFEAWLREARAVD